MFTPAHGCIDSIDATHAAFRQLAEAETHQQATTPDTTRLVHHSRAEWPQHRGRVAAAIASVLISIGLLGSVVIGLTSMPDPAATTEARKSAPSCEVVVGKAMCSPHGPAA